MRFQNSVSAIAANGIFSYGLGAVFPLFNLQMYEAIGVHWAGSVFAIVGLAGIPIPWIFFKYGRYDKDRNMRRIRIQKDDSFGKLLMKGRRSTALLYI